MIRRAAGAAAPASCATGAPVSTAGAGTGTVVDRGLANGTAYRYRACLTGAGGTSSGVTGTATPSSGVDTTPPRPVRRLAVRALGGRVVLGWRNPADRDFGIGPGSAQVRLPADVAERRQGRLPRRPPVAARLSVLAPQRQLRRVRARRGRQRGRRRARLAAALRSAAADAVRPLRDPQSRPRFTWKKKAGADGYSVRCAHAKRCCNPRGDVRERLPKTVSLRAPRALRRGTYVWYVAAHLSAGQALSSYDALTGSAGGPVPQRRPPRTRPGPRRRTARTGRARRRARPRPRASPRARSAPPRRSDSRRCRSRWPGTRSTGSRELRRLLDGAPVAHASSSASSGRPA